MAAAAAQPVPAMAAAAAQQPAAMEDAAEPRAEAAQPAPSTEELAALAMELARERPSRKRGGGRAAKAAPAI